MLLKRIDLWNVYIDQEIKQDNKTSDEDDTDIKSKVEDLFERVLSKKSLENKLSSSLING